MPKLIRAALIGAACAAAACGSPGQATYITILTGSTSGVYYPLGVGLSQIFRTAVPEATVSVQATAGSTENLNLLQAGRGEFGFTLGDALLDAWKGSEAAGFKVPLDRLRVIAGIYSNYVQIVASAESGIATLEDLKGHRISVGPPGSGTELNARAIVRAAGLTYDDFSKVEYLSFGESVDLMKNRQLDVTLQSSGLGVASLRDLASSVRTVMVPIPAGVVQAVGNPVYLPGVIPAGTYEGQAAPVETATIQNFVVTHDGVSDDLVYRMTRSMFEHLDRLVAAHVSAREISREHAVKNLPLPLHPGAARYFREAGLIE
jgi:TRAP transporter TAXI family solute receptor